MFCGHDVLWELTQILGNHLLLCHKLSWFALQHAWRFHISKIDLFHPFMILFCRTLEQANQQQISEWIFVMASHFLDFLDLSCNKSRTMSLVFSTSFQTILQEIQWQIFPWIPLDCCATLTQTLTCKRSQSLDHTFCLLDSHSQSSVQLENLPTGLAANVLLSMTLGVTFVPLWLRWTFVSGKFWWLMSKSLMALDFCEMDQLQCELRTPLRQNLEKIFVTTDDSWHKISWWMLFVL